MSNSFLKHLLAHISSFKFLFFNKNKFIKSEILFDIVEYKSEYLGNHLSAFFLSLLLNISEISKEIKIFINQKKIINITSILTFYEKETNSEYSHALSDSNQLYSLDNFDMWSTSVISNLIKKLEIYSSFTKISLTISVNIIEKL